MNKLFKVLIIILLIITVILMLRIADKIGLIEGFGLFSSKDKIDEVSFIVQDIKDLIFLTTQSFYDEIFFDTGEIKTGILSQNKRLAIIAQGTVKAGFDLTGLENTVQNINGKIKITLPEPKVLSVTSNPSQREIFISHGAITQSEINHVSKLIKEKLEENAIKKRILQKCKEHGSYIFDKLLNLWGYEDVEITISKSSGELHAENLIQQVRDRNFKNQSQSRREFKYYKIKYYISDITKPATIFVRDTIDHSDNSRQQTFHNINGAIIMEIKNNKVSYAGNANRNRLLLDNIKNTGFIDSFIPKLPSDKLSYYYYKDVELLKSKYHILFSFYGEKKWKKIFINSNTKLIDIVEDEGKMNKQQEVRDIFYRNYRTIAGVKIPRLIEIYIYNRKILSVEILDIRYN